MLCVLRQCTFGLHTFIDWGLGVVIWLKWERIYYRWTNAKEERTDEKLRRKESSIHFCIKELAAFHMCENITDGERGSKKTSSSKNYVRILRFYVWTHFFLSMKRLLLRLSFTKFHQNANIIHQNSWFSAFFTILSLHCDCVFG